MFSVVIEDDSLSDMACIGFGMQVERVLWLGYSSDLLPMAQVALGLVTGYLPLFHSSVLVWRMGMVRKSEVYITIV